MKYIIARSKVKFTNGIMVGSPSLTLPFLGIVLNKQQTRQLRKYGATQFVV